MELKLRLTRKRVAIVVVLAALLAAGVGYAAIPDGSGVYTACMLNKIGTIRIIDPASQKCTASLETQITFGAKGEKGEQGLQGLKGEKGEKGDKGDQGLQGLKGDDGSQGLQGLKGDKGDKGDQGDQGIPGIQGLKGDQGIPGENGDKGDQGIPGDKGDKGDKGDQGLKGDPGQTGPAGPAGPTGPAGAADVTMVSAPASVQPGATASSGVNCPAGHPNVTGGGWTIDDSFESFAQVVESNPFFNPFTNTHGWTVKIKNLGGSIPMPMTVWATCVK